MESDRLELRLLTRDQIPMVWTIDRAEIIERIYVRRDAELHLQPDFSDMRGWPPGEPEKDTHVLRTRQHTGRGAWPRPKGPTEGEGPADRRF